MMRTLVSKEEAGVKGNGSIKRFGKVELKRCLAEGGFGFATPVELGPFCASSPCACVGLLHMHNAQHAW